MNHPDDLLAPYVDGALSTAERNAVTRHLATCERCATEVELAGRAEPGAPIDAGGGGAGGSRGPGDRGGRAERRRACPEVTPLRESASRANGLRWVAAAVGIAAVIVLVATTLPNVGGQGSSEAALPAAAEGGAVASIAPASRVEIQDVDYDVDSVQALAGSFARAAAPGVSGAPASPPWCRRPRPGGAGVTAEGRPRTDRLSAAAACLSKAFADPQGELVRLIDARFRGTPAYIGIYLAGPGAGQPPDSALVADRVEARLRDPALDDHQALRISAGSRFGAPE